MEWTGDVRATQLLIQQVAPLMFSMAINVASVMATIPPSSDWAKFIISLSPL